METGNKGSIISNYLYFNLMSYGGRQLSVIKRQLSPFDIMSDGENHKVLLNPNNLHLTMEVDN